MVTGIFLCFVLPGILIGLLLAQSYHAAQKKARSLKKKRALESRRRLYVYDMRAEHAGLACSKAA